MIFNVKQFLQEYNIKYSEDGLNSHKGWIQINCPFCGDRLFHGGFKLSTGSYSCWRCKYHKVTDVIQLLLKCNSSVAKTTYNRFLNIPFKGPNNPIASQKPLTLYPIKGKKLSLPMGIFPLELRHKKYLINRGFDPEKLIQEWGLLGTNHLGKYKFRIIAPIYLNYIMVSYQGRDITEKAKERYKACMINDELYHHKYTLYGIDNVPSNIAVIVEGITDVWRMGYGSVGTFGTEFTQPQVNMLSKRFDTYFIMYDPDDAGQEAAEKLSSSLYAIKRNATIEIITLDNVEDPGKLQQDEANYIMKQLMS